MATTLATARTDLATVLSSITTAQTYRRRQTNYQYPCFLVGWPTEFDVRAAMDGNARNMTIPVLGSVEVTDDDSADDALSAFMESAVTALLASATYDVQPVTDFDSQQSEDNRVILSFVLLVDILA